MSPGCREITIGIQQILGSPEPGRSLPPFVVSPRLEQRILPPFGMPGKAIVLPDQMAQMILTVEAGVRLEQAADPEGSADSAAFERLRRFAEPPAPPGNTVDGARRST